jgi:hypothetical protein
MGVLIAQNPTSTMKMHHHGQDSAGLWRAHDADAHRSGRPDRERCVLDHGIEFRHGLGLRSSENVAGRCRAEGVERWTASGRQGIDEALGRWLKHWAGRAAICNRGSSSGGGSSHGSLLEIRVPGTDHAAEGACAVLQERTRTCGGKLRSLNQGLRRENDTA